MHGGNGHGTWPQGPSGGPTGPGPTGPGAVGPVGPGPSGPGPGGPFAPQPGPHQGYPGGPPFPHQQPPHWGPQPPHPYGPRPPRRPPTRGQNVWRGIRNPLYAAQRAFRPSRPERVEDGTVRRLQVWRTLLGIAAWVCLTVTYGAISDADKAEDAVYERATQSWISALVLICTFPVVVGAFVAAARGPLRGLYLRRALRSLGAIGALMGSMATFPLAMAPESEGFRDLVGLPGKIVIGIACLWCLGFALYGVALSLVHVFRTADIHELVPPVLATVLVWEMALLDVIGGEYAQVPPLARAVFILGAPATVTALSCWEVHRLRRHHGLSLRRALRP